MEDYSSELGNGSKQQTSDDTFLGTFSQAVKKINENYLLMKEKKYDVNTVILSDLGAYKTVQAPDFNTVTEFENRIAEFFGAPYAVAVDSCTSALELCLIDKKATKITCPRRTYLSVPMLANKLKIDLEWSDDEWTNYYELSPGIYDAAVLWEKDSYISGSVMCISFQYQKHLSLGRAGVILTDNNKQKYRLRKLSYDGRTRGIPWREQNIKRMGYHYSITPELAELGLKKLPDAISSSPRKWKFLDWPDISVFPVFKQIEEPTVWLPVVGYEGYYEVSDKGRVKRTAIGNGTKGGFMRPYDTGKSLEVKLTKHDRNRGHLVHTLVLQAFVCMRPEGMECCHNDGDYKNNHVKNLRWDTHKSNTADTIKHGKFVCNKGEKHGMSKLSDKDVVKIKTLISEGEKLKDIAVIYSVNAAAISNIKSGKSWKHI